MDEGGDGTRVAGAGGGVTEVGGHDSGRGLHRAEPEVVARGRDGHPHQVAVLLDRRHDAGHDQLCAKTKQPRVDQRAGYWNGRGGMGTTRALKTHRKKVGVARRSVDAARHQQLHGRAHRP